MSHEIQNKLLRLPAVSSITGKKRSSIYLMMANGEFPKPIKLSKRSVGWLENEVNDWINERIRLSRLEERANHGK
jgi:prophage regulatory protein